ncbi:phospho-acceptor domain-containing protein [Balneicella halophila]|uniref:histidine kinase n=1 Tax=Balneicella halophila TaxID=1537566 RepID=A0A7L4USY0_BALHA|nr:ATP-binding protein [Balneicella halophila]PVX52367.1 phospho-acceptor domain-containing protein [Balneicella halophila]
MRRILKPYNFLWISGLILLGLAFILNSHYLNENTDIKRFKSSLRQKENLADKTLILFEDRASLTAFIENQEPATVKDDIAYLVYEDKELVYWSNNLINIPEVYEESFYDQALIKLNNGYYATRIHSFHNKKMVALIPIYYEYNVKSSYLESTFHPDLQLLYDTNLSRDAEQGHFISNKEGKYLFSLIQTNKLITDSPLCIMISILYVLGFILLMSFFIVRFRNMQPWNQMVFTLLLTIVFIGLRVIMLHYQLPASLYSLRLFSAELHASSDIFRSLGDYWINSLLIFLWVYFISCFRVNRTSLVQKNKFILLGGYMTFTIFLGLFVFTQVESLVLNSSFSLQVHTGSGMEIYTIWAYAGVALLVSALLISIRTLTLRFYQLIKLREFYILWFSLLIVFGVVIFFINRFLIFHLVFLGVLGFIQSTIRYKTTKEYNYTLQVLAIFLSAFYLTFLINIYSEVKEKQIRTAKAVSIMDSNDPVTKARLETMSNDWIKDNLLLSLFQDPLENEIQIKEYLRNQYFNRDWSNYNVQILICADGDEIEMIDSEGENTYSDCFFTFNSLIESASRIGNSYFYELNTYKGVTPYIGMLTFMTEFYGEIRLFVHLDLKPYEDQQGYPGLLTSEEYEVNYQNRYSIAKYINGRLRYSNGDFDYYSLFNNFKSDKKTNYFIDVDDYKHFVYRVTDSYKIVISQEKLSFYKRYIAFPYLFFLLFFIILSIWILETYPSYYFYYHSVRQQIKIALITMITIVFIVVGGASLYFSYKSNQKQYQQEHKEKIQMLRREIFNNIESAKDLDPNFNINIEQRLQDYSRILDADINIYDVYGVLLSTSQPEMFSKEIISNRMNFSAFNGMNSHNTTEITIQERIGNLEYTSVYVTLWNNINEPVAYLNVPYFMKYKRFKAEMQDVIIGVLNINLLLIILALIVAYIISQRITSPLVMLQEKFSKIRLGKKNEKIFYEKDDEIKVLVNTYNKMVDELEESTELLAQSERESAWREMARQVAHEIKNPLTPMKLNIQFLQHRISKDSDNWEEQFKQLSDVLLKQIDELAAIASAFSDFAKLPTLKNEELDLLALLEELTILYNKGEIDMRLSTSLKDILIYADHNRIRRAFINLITNAIQSIKNPEKGQVEIVVTQKQSDFIEVAIVDNGSGIPEEARAKIFSPSFTTKSSGMGLGLALTKDIINQANGIISFESEVEKGTTFRVTLPTIESHP